MADDIRYTKIGRSLGSAGFKHTHDSDTHHVFQHHKSGNTVDVEKGERVGGHAWTYKQGGKLHTTGIGHASWENHRSRGSIKESILPGFLNFITEKEIKVKVKAKVKIEVPDDAKVKAKGK